MRKQIILWASVLFFLSLWVGSTSRLFAQGTGFQKQQFSRKDSTKKIQTRATEVELDESKALDLLRQALDFEQKQELRNALRCFFQALAYYEKVNDQVRQVGVLEEIGRLYDLWEVPERAIDYYQRALIKINSHSLKLNSLGKIHLKLAEGYVGMEKFDLAEKHYREALAYDPEPQNPEFSRRALSGLSNVYRGQKKLDEVLNTNLQIIDLERKWGSGPNLSLALNNAGFIYKSIGDYEKALSYINQAIENENNLKSKDVQGMVTMRINLASTLNQQKRYTAALGELFRALKMAEKNRLLTMQAEIRNYIALIYYNLQDFQNAHFNCEIAVEFSRRSGDAEMQVKTFRTYAIILERLGSFKEAYQFLDKCNILKDSIFNEDRKKSQDKLLKRINVERTEKDLKLLLTDSEKTEFELQKISLEAERNQKDLELIKKEKTLQEFLYKSKSLENEKALQLSQIQAQRLESEKVMQEMALQQFETAISGQELERKNRENKILLLEQEKKILEKNRTLQKSMLQAQSTRERYFKAIGILIAMVLASVLYGLIQIRNKNHTLSKKQAEIASANAALEGLNQEIIHKNKNITDSIQYARGIQEAILPESEKWFSVFPESFIFYQPKDIVSGDFYFLTEVNSKWYLAFADCTGHGVPGALMSLIGHNLLSNIIEVQEDTDPSSILKKIDHGIQKTLRSQNTEIRAGMELGLCIFDFEQKILQFSSSMRPLIGIRNGELVEWKGDRHTLGADSGEFRDFTTHTIDINSLDAIYLFSDGYQDQLGGPDGKRFLSNRLKNLILEASSSNIADQETKVVQTMKNWIGDNKQLDDIMLIGIKLNRTA